MVEKIKKNKETRLIIIGLIVLLVLWGSINYYRSLTTKVDEVMAKEDEQVTNTKEELEEDTRTLEDYYDMYYDILAKCNELDKVITEKEEEYQEVISHSYVIPMPKEHMEFVYKTCNKYNISPELVFAVIKLESNFNQYATNKANSNGTEDNGYMQINNRYQDEYAKLISINPKDFDPFNAYHNLEAGIKKLSTLRKQCISQKISEEETWLTVLNGYNMGVVGYRKYIKSGHNPSRYYDKAVLTYKTVLEMTGELSEHKTWKQYKSELDI